MQSFDAFHHTFRSVGGTDGFTELAQRLGANSVIATLWNIADLGAPEWETNFYCLYLAHEDWPKSELLRRSQLDLLTGRCARAGRADRPRANRLEG